MITSGRLSSFFRGSPWKLLIPSVVLGLIAASFTLAQGKWISVQALVQVVQSGAYTSRDGGGWLESDLEVTAYTMRRIRDSVHFEFGTSSFLTPSDKSAFLKDVRMLSGSTGMLQLDAFGRTETEARTLLSEVEKVMNEKFRFTGWRTQPVPPITRDGKEYRYQSERITFQTMSSKVSREDPMPSPLSDLVYVTLASFICLYFLRLIFSPS